MPRRGLHWTGGLVLHVLNRGVRRLRLFDRPADYQAFLRVVGEGQERTRIRLLAYCLMPNHFHLVVWPEEHGQLVEFMWWFQTTHSKRWHQARGSHGTGSVYQGRYKAIPVQTDGHFLTLCRYVERNPLRAGLVQAAERWPWSSLSQRRRNSNAPRLEPWPIPQPEDWLRQLNAPPDPETELIRRCIRRGLPLGGERWVEDQRKTPGVFLSTQKDARRL